MQAKPNKGKFAVQLMPWLRPVARTCLNILPWPSLIMVTVMQTPELKLLLVCVLR